MDNNIEETLASAYSIIDYPEYEIVFCVAEDNDPVIALIEALMEDHPRVPSRLLIGDDRISINPKLNNLVKGWRERHATSGIVMIDTNVLLAARLPGPVARRGGAPRRRNGLLAAERLGPKAPGRT